MAGTLREGSLISPYHLLPKDTSLHAAVQNTASAHKSFSRKLQEQWLPVIIIAIMMTAEDNDKENLIDTRSASRMISVRYAAYRKNVDAFQVWFSYRGDGWYLEVCPQDCSWLIKTEGISVVYRLDKPDTGKLCFSFIHKSSCRIKEVLHVCHYAF